MFIHSIKVGTALRAGIHYFNRELLQMLIESQSGTDPGPFGRAGQPHA